MVKDKYNPNYNPPYSVVTIDFPLDYREWSDKGKSRSPSNHYEGDKVLDLEVLKTMPDLLLPIMERGGVILLWVTNTHKYELFKVVQHWEKKYSLRYGTTLFTWAKLLKKTDRMNQGAFDGFEPPVNDPAIWHSGTGHYTRQNTEECWLIRRRYSPPTRVDLGVRQLIVAPLGEHSRKPVEFHEGVERLYGNVKRLELFARPPFRAGWDVAGNEVDGLDIRVALQQIGEAYREKTTE